MIQTSYPINGPNFFKLKVKHPIKYYNKHHASCLSLHVIIESILGSHVSMVVYTLGWDDGTSLAPKVEGMACDCYTKCGETPPCPTTPNPCSTPINPPWCP